VTTTSKQLRCSGCDTRYDVSRRKPGKRVRCPRCQTVMRVPEPGEGPSDPVTSSDILRRSKGPTCLAHKKERGVARCRDCRSWMCRGCQAPAPVSHYCERCADRRELAGALPLDFGVVPTTLLAVRAFAGSVLRCALWNFVSILATFTVFAVPIALGVYFFREHEAANSVSAMREIWAGIALGGISGAWVTYYGLLVPAGCSLFVDAAIRGQKPSLGSAFGTATRRLIRNAGSLFLVLLLLILLYLPFSVLLLAGGFYVDQAAGPLAAVLLIAVGLLLGFFALMTTLGLAVPVVVLEERSATEALTRAWSLASDRLPEIGLLVLGFAIAYGGWCVVDAQAIGALGRAGAPLVLLTVVVDAVWPALLTAIYHGLAADDGAVLGRH
jgi:hypothetical protein